MFGKIETLTFQMFQALESFNLIKGEQKDNYTLYASIVFGILRKILELDKIRRI